MTGGASNGTTAQNVWASSDTIACIRWQCLGADKSYGRSLTEDQRRGGHPTGGWSKALKICFLAHQIQFVIKYISFILRGLIVLFSYSDLSYFILRYAQHVNTRQKSQKTRFYAQKPRLKMPSKNSISGVIISRSLKHLKCPPPPPGLAGFDSLPDSGF